MRTAWKNKTKSSGPSFEVDGLGGGLRRHALTAALPSPTPGKQRLNRHPQHAGKLYQFDVGHAPSAQLDPRYYVAAHVPTCQLALGGEFLLRQSQTAAEAHELRAYGVLGFGHVASVLRRRSVPCLALGLCVEIHTSHSLAYL